MTLKVLYIDDEPGTRLLAKLAMESSGLLDVHDYDSGEEALQDIDEITPNLVVVDVMMGGMTGPQVLQQLRKIPAHAQTPVIFLTSNIDPVQVQSYYALGVIGVIPKPFDPFKLAEHIQVLWETHRKVEGLSTHQK